MVVEVFDLPLSNSTLKAELPFPQDQSPVLETLQGVKREEDEGSGG